MSDVNPGAQKPTDDSARPKGEPRKGDWEPRQATDQPTPDETV